MYSVDILSSLIIDISCYLDNWLFIRELQLFAKLSVKDTEKICIIILIMWPQHRLCDRHKDEEQMHNTQSHIEYFGAKWIIFWPA